MSHHSTIPSDLEIRRLYFDEKLPLKAIGRKVGLSGSGVGLRLKCMGESLRPRGQMEGRSRKLTESQKQEIVALYRDGCAGREIERRFGISKPTRITIVRRAGYEIRPADTKINFPPEIADQYRQGATIQEIAKQYEVAYQTVRGELLRLGVVLREKAPVGNTRAKEWHEKLHAKLEEATAIATKKEELERKIAELQRQIDALPKIGRKPGRKPERETFEAILKLHAEGVKKWGKIAKILNMQFNVHRDPDAYRKLYNRNSKNVPRE